MDNCLPVAAASPLPKPRRAKRATRPQLLKLDRRTNAAKFLAALIASVEPELGRRDRLGIIERNHVEGYAGTVLLLQNLNARLARGEKIDFSEHTQVCKVMMNFTSLLGLKGGKQHNAEADHGWSSLPVD